MHTTGLDIATLVVTALTFAAIFWQAWETRKSVGKTQQAVAAAQASVAEAERARLEDSRARMDQRAPSVQVRLTGESTAQQVESGERVISGRMKGEILNGGLAAVAYLAGTLEGVVFYSEDMDTTESAKGAIEQRLLLAPNEKRGIWMNVKLPNPDGLSVSDFFKTLGPVAQVVIDDGLDNGVRDTIALELRWGLADVRPGEPARNTFVHMPPRLRQHFLSKDRDDLLPADA